MLRKRQMVPMPARCLLAHARMARFQVRWRKTLDGLDGLRR